jgi:hypothetical protein
VRGALALLVLAAGAAARHTVEELVCPPAVDYRVARDLDGDGIDDLLLVHAREAWLWRGRADTPRREPSARMPLPEGTCLFAIEGKTLVARTASGYFAVEPGRPPRPLPRRAGPGLPFRARNVLWRGFLADFDRDGRPDSVDAALDGYTIEYGAGGSVTLPPERAASAETWGRAVSERHLARIALAAWAEGRFDGDDRPDFAVVTGSGLLVYTGGEDGRLDPSRRIAIELREAARADLLFADLNGDGRTDALAVEGKEGLATVLLGHPERGLYKPSRVPLAVRGTLRTPVVEDLDGDGRIDLALPFFPTPSVQDAVRWFVRGEVLIEVPIFLNRGGAEPFSRVADAKVTVPIRIRVSADAGGRVSVGGLAVVEYGGDLDGDGRRDLLVTERTDLLAVRRGVASGVFAEAPSEHIAVPDAAPYDSVASAAADLNGDGASDIILHYRGAGRRPDRILLLVSRKE